MWIGFKCFVLLNKCEWFYRWNFEFKLYNCEYVKGNRYRII